MKQKTLTYASTAVIIGLAIMILPLALRTYMPYAEFLKPADTSGYGRTGPEQSDQISYHNETQNLATYLLPISLIFLSGLVIAASAYVILQRRMY